MSKLLFRLNHVPEEEADAVRALLDEHHYDYFETHEGRWGLSVAAIWLKNDDDFTPARVLLNEFQQTHSQRMRAEFEQAKKEGRVPNFWQLLSSNPIMFSLYWLLILIILFLTLVPVWSFFN